MQGLSELEGTVLVISVGERVLIRGPCRLSQPPSQAEEGLKGDQVENIHKAWVHELHKTSAAGTRLWAGDQERAEHSLRSTHSDHRTPTVP